jgi:hypothetical protein
MTLMARLFDERFMHHRLRSTSLAGIAGAAVAGGCFLWHYYVDHVWVWELLAVMLTMLAVKWALMAWWLTRE